MNGTLVIRREVQCLDSLLRIFHRFRIHNLQYGILINNRGLPTRFMLYVRSDTAQEAMSNLVMLLVEILNLEEVVVVEDYDVWRLNLDLPNRWNIYHEYV